MVAQSQPTPVYTQPQPVGAGPGPATLAATAAGQMDRKTKTAIALAKHQAYGGVLHVDGPQPQSATPISPAPAVSPALQKAKSAVAALSQADLLALQKSLPPAKYTGGQ